jgi:hypothetical protein
MAQGREKILHEGSQGFVPAMEGNDGDIGNIDDGRETSPCMA